MAETGPAPRRRRTADPPATDTTSAVPSPPDANARSIAPNSDPEPAPDYRLDDQVGFRLRQAMQRHTAIFAAGMAASLTPTQFAAMARIAEVGATSQNELGRLTAMDVATIKGVVDRLRERGLIVTTPDPADRRRILIALSPDGTALLGDALAAGHRITAETVAPLTATEARELLRLLAKIS